MVLVLNATCVLFGYEETWENGKRNLLENIRFLETLIEFDTTKCLELRFIKFRNNYLLRDDFKRDLVIK